MRAFALRWVGLHSLLALLSNVEGNRIRIGIGGKVTEVGGVEGDGGIDRLDLSERGKGD